MNADDELTFDTLLRGRVKLIQPVRGFRSSLDPVLLAAFVAPPFGRFLDIGCGTGALSFLLLARDADASGVGLEIQPALAALSRRGSADNGFAGRFNVVVGDARQVAATFPEGSFDLVATNPPFRPLGTGVLPVDQQRSLANHEVALALSDWLDVAARALRPGGRLAVVFPADRTNDLLSGLRARGLSPTRRRAVHPQSGQPARRVLVEALRAPPRTAASEIVEPALVVHASGGFTDEVRAMLGEATP